MVSVTIGTETRDLADADERWINDKIGRRDRDGVPICVVVQVQTGGLDLRLSTPGCGGGAGGRRPNPNELEVIELWQKHHLATTAFASGNVLAFLKQLRRML